MLKHVSDLPVLVSVTLSPPFTPTQYLQYVYLEFNLNVPISWRCITCLVGLTGNSFLNMYMQEGGGKIFLIITSVRTEWQEVK